MSNRILRRAGAGITVSALAFTGFLVASPASAASGDETAPTSGSAFEAKARSLFSLDGLVTVGRDKDDNFVVVTEPDAPEKTKQAVADLDHQYDNVVTELSEPATAYSGTDVVGGAGYVFPVGASAAACSVGFTAWTPTGGPALLTAGHCADGADAPNYRSVPSTDPGAGTGGTGFVALDEIGDFGFGQFGGPGNSAGADNDANSVDIAVIDVTNTALALKPAVTDWTTAASDDLSTSSIPITSIGNPTFGTPISKSGRTTGYTTGGTLAIQGWANIGGHWVRGFQADGLLADHGDSGGAVIQGKKAVGVVSGGPEDNSWTWASNIADTLPLTGGYTLQLALDAPTVTVAASSAPPRPPRLTGTAPAGSTVTVTGPAGFTATVTAAADGSWSFVTPMTTGAFPITAKATIGFNVSPELSTTVTLIAAPLTAPVVTSPIAGTGTTPVTTITGKANPGYTVSVTGDVTGTAVVDADGNWSIPAGLGIGEHSISVTQAYEADVSDPTVVAFEITAVVVPPVVVPGGTTATPASTGTDGALADTGSDVTPFVGGALGLLLAGGILLIVRRRRATA